MKYRKPWAVAAMVVLLGVAPGAATADGFTPLLLAAEARGLVTSNGLDMLLYQGVRSFEIWTETTPPIDVMRDALRKAVE